MTGTINAYLGMNRMIGLPSMVSGRGIRYVGLIGGEHTFVVTPAAFDRLRATGWTFNRDAGHRDD